MRVYIRERDRGKSKTSRAYGANTYYGKCCKNGDNKQISYAFLYLHLAADRNVVPGSSCVSWQYNTQDIDLVQQMTHI